MTDELKETDATENAPIAVLAKDLVKRYESLVAVNGVDIRVFKGECFGLLGPNGAGKTTTVEIIEGLTTADKGTVEINGLKWGAGRGYKIRERIGVQLQDNQIADKLTVEEVLTLFRSFYRQGLSVEEALDLFELQAKRTTRYHKLSGGQKQRLSLACAMINTPDIVFLDEPTTGLDPQARQRVWEMVETFRNKGGTVVLTTHYMEEAEHLCDRLAIMDHGQIILEGTPSQLITDLGADQIVQFRIANLPDSAVFDDLPGVTAATQREDAFWLNVTAIEQALPALLGRINQNKWTLEYLRTEQATLDDVFLAHTGRGLRDG